MTNKYNVGDTVYAKGKILQVEDSFVEPPAKPTLPKGVADELEQAKHEVGDFDNYIQAVIENKRNRYPQSSRYWYGPRESNTETLLNAWNNGYTVEKPKRYNLIFNDDLNGKIACLFKQPILDELWAAYETSDINFKHDERYQFTQEEIDKYNKNFLMNNTDLNDYKVEVSTDE